MADDGRFLTLTAVGIVPAAQVKDYGMERLFSPSFFSHSILHTPYSLTPHYPRSRNREAVTAHRH